MKRWIALLFVAIAACGGGSTTTLVEAAGPDMTGLKVEVHQAPG